MFDTDECRECAAFAAENHFSVHCDDCDIQFVESLVDGMDLTKGKVYAVEHKYDTVYDLQCDTCRYCRPKEFFKELTTSGTTPDTE